MAWSRLGGAPRNRPHHRPFPHPRRAGPARGGRIGGSIELKGERLNISDWEKLKQAGRVKRAYLHLMQKDAAA